MTKITDIREATVASLKEQYEAGTYFVTSEEVAGAMLHTERCPYHRDREYPIYQECPQCYAMRESGRREEYRKLHAEELRDVEVAVNWDRWLAQAVVTVLAVVFLVGLWMAAQNRAIGKKHDSQYERVQ